MPIARVGENEVIDGWIREHQTGEQPGAGALLADGAVLVAGGEVVKVGFKGGSIRCCVVYDYLAVTASVELE